MEWRRDSDSYNPPALNDWTSLHHQIQSIHCVHSFHLISFRSFSPFNAVEINLNYFNWMFVEEVKDIAEAITHSN